jgi:hypothetical protein
MGGALVGFLAATALAIGGSRSGRIRRPKVFSFYEPSAFDRIGDWRGDALIGHFIENTVAWLVGGWVASVLYMVLAAPQITLVVRSDTEEAAEQDQALRQ